MDRPVFILAGVSSLEVRHAGKQSIRILETHFQSVGRKQGRTGSSSCESQQLTMHHITAVDVDCLSGHLTRSGG